MSRSLLEKYEQMLEQDPTSTVFVELARALLEKGDNERAITVCKQGVGHHPGSVVGRVLWGKALINVGKAAEAMSQFDLAMGLNRENPHAYNLISEVLIRKALYRSALPILRKASALQPNDGRIKQWLEQTKAALSGGPAPVLYDSTNVTDGLDAAATEAGTTATSAAGSVTDAAPVVDRSATDTSVPVAASVTETGVPVTRPRADQAATLGATTTESSGPQGDPDVFSAFAAAKPDPSAEPTVVIGAYDPTSQTAAMPPLSEEPPTQNAERPGPPVPTGEMPAVIGQVPARVSVGPIRTSSQENLPVVEGRVTQELESPEAPDPFAEVPSAQHVINDTFRGLTSTFNALEQGAGPLPAPAASPRPRVAPRDEPSVIPAADLLAPAAQRAVQAQAAQGGGLLDDVASAQNDIPTGEVGLPTQRPNVATASPRPIDFSDGHRPLLEEIPDQHPFDAPHADSHRVEFNTQATEAIAKEYERELRAKLEANTRKKTFLQLHGAKIAVIVGVLVVVGGLAGSFVATRIRHKGENLDSAIGKALAATTADTREQYLAAIISLDGALQMDDSSAAAWAWKGYAHAVLYAEHGRQASDRDAALAAYQHTGVRDAHQELAAVVDFLTSDEAQLAASRQQLLGSSLDASVVHAQIGRVLLEDKKYDDALKQLQRAVELDGKNVRALVALGDYYLAFADYEQAIQVLEGPAGQLSKFHPSRVMGLSQARLELGRDQAQALSDLEDLPKNGSVPESMKGRYALVFGRALSANGKHEQALRTLSDGLADNKDLAFEFQMALGWAMRNAGQMAGAQKAYEEALKLQPKSEPAREGLGRVLLARSREKELLDRLKPEKDARRVALVRGIAASRLNDFKRARTELTATQVGGKYPAEAVVYLALADAAEEAQSDKAIQMLERLAKESRRHRATVQVALARVYMQRGALDKARAQLEEAAKDPGDYEGNALLGELLFNAGVPADVAMEPLQRAVDRNGSHAPARHLLTKVLLAQGKHAEALKNVETWTADNPALEQAWVDAALVYLRASRVKDAEAAIQRADKLNFSSVDGNRVKAMVLFARGDAKGGFAALERANKLDPKDAETFCEIGNAFVRQGNYDTAMKAFEAALREDAKSVCGLVGPHHARPGLRGAKTALSNVLKNVSDSWMKAFVEATLARTLLEERDVNGAAKLAQEATQAEPALAVAWLALAEALQKQKDSAKALEAYQKASTLDYSWAGAHLAYADALARAGGDQLPNAIAEYDLAYQLSQNEGEQARAKKWATTLRKQLK